MDVHERSWLVKGYPGNPLSTQPIFNCLSGVVMI
jgi:hypothetical protein